MDRRALFLIFCILAVSSNVEAKEEGYTVALNISGTKLMFKANCDNPRFGQGAPLQAMCQGDVYMNLTNIGDRDLTDAVTISSFWADRCHNSFNEEHIHDEKHKIYESLNSRIDVTSIPPHTYYSADHLGNIDVPPQYECQPGCLMAGVKNPIDDVWHILAAKEAVWSDPECASDADYWIDVHPSGPQPPTIQLTRATFRGEAVYHFNIWDYIQRVEINVDRTQKARPKPLAHALTMYFRDRLEWRHHVYNTDIIICGNGDLVPEISLLDELVVDIPFSDRLESGPALVIDRNSHPNATMKFDNRTCPICGNVSLIIQLDALHTTNDPDRCNNFMSVNVTIDCPNEIFERDQVVQVIPDILSQGATTHFKRCSAPWDSYSEPRIFTRKHIDNAWSSRQASEMDDGDSILMMKGRVLAKRMLQIEKHTSGESTEDICREIMKKDSIRLLKRQGYSNDSAPITHACRGAILEMISGQERISTGDMSVFDGILSRCPSDAPIFHLVDFYIKHRHDMESGRLDVSVMYDLGNPETRECPKSRALWDMFSGRYQQSPGASFSPFYQQLTYIGSEIERRNQMMNRNADMCEDAIRDSEACAYRLASDVMMSSARLSVANYSRAIKEAEADRHYVDIKQAVRSIHDYMNGTSRYAADDLDYLDECEKPDIFKPDPYIPVYHKVINNTVFVTVDASSLGSEPFCWHPVGMVHCPNCHNYYPNSYANIYPGPSSPPFG